jgi:hypothetical protein
MKLPRQLIENLKAKLQITTAAAEVYVVEYKRFLLMAACSKFMVSPSE